MTYKSEKHQPDPVFTSDQRRVANAAPVNSSSTSADLMTPKAAGAYLGIEVSTLAMWRSTKRYPLPYVKVGRLVLYRKSHLDAFLAARTVDMNDSLQKEASNG